MVNDSKLSSFELEAIDKNGFTAYLHTFMFRDFLNSGVSSYSWLGSSSGRLTLWGLILSGLIIFLTSRSSSNIRLQRKDAKWFANGWNNFIRFANEACFLLRQWKDIKSIEVFSNETSVLIEVLKILGFLSVNFIYLNFKRWPFTPVYKSSFKRQLIWRLSDLDGIKLINFYKLYMTITLRGNLVECVPLSSWWTRRPASR